MSIEDNQLKNILEAALMAVGKPMTMEQLMVLFTDEDRPSASRIKSALSQLQADCEGRGIELKDVASGYRYQARQDYAEWLSRLWEERAPKYSRAYLETLALIAYRQPVTRAEIEEVRGVSVSSNIMKTMLEREWIRVVGHRDVPGRPSLYATTRQFLDYFNMKSLDELPTLAEIRDLEDLSPELDLSDPDYTTSENTEESDSDSDNPEMIQSDDTDELNEDDSFEVNEQSETLDGFELEEDSSVEVLISDEYEEESSIIEQTFEDDFDNTFDDASDDTSDDASDDKLADDAERDEVFETQHEQYETDKLNSDTDANEWSDTNSELTEEDKSAT